VLQAVRQKIYPTENRIAAMSIFAKLTAQAVAENQPANKNRHDIGTFHLRRAIARADKHLE
jgi:hypothetical protein